MLWIGTLFNTTAFVMIYCSVRMYTHRALKCSKNTRTAHDIGIRIETLKWPGGSGHANSRILASYGIIVSSCVWTITEGWDDPNEWWVIHHNCPCHIWQGWLHQNLWSSAHLALHAPSSHHGIGRNTPTFPMVQIWYYWKCQQLALRRTSSPLRWVSASLPRLFQTFAKGFLTVPKWRCWRKHRVDTKMKSHREPFKSKRISNGLTWNNGISHLRNKQLPGKNT